MNPKQQKTKVKKNIVPTWTPVPIKEESKRALLGGLKTSLESCFHPLSSWISSEVLSYSRIDFGNGVKFYLIILSNIITNSSFHDIADNCGQDKDDDERVGDRPPMNSFISKKFISIPSWTESFGGSCLIKMSESVTNCWIYNPLDFIREKYLAFLKDLNTSFLGWAYWWGFLLLVFFSFWLSSIFRFFSPFSVITMFTILIRFETRK